MSRTVRYASTSLLLCVVATAWAGPSPVTVPARATTPPTVAYVPASDPAVNASLLAGLRASLAGRKVRLVVGRTPGRWSNAAPEAARLVCKERAVVLITPPDRRVAHLMAKGTPDGFALGRRAGEAVLARLAGRPR